ncbi:MAG: DEAD/DEAH box helicase family protein [Actinobacteria bacterium]|nr:DEAD/DEAH box helicase family protein [Actinomycetota bacterium]
MATSIRLRPWQKAALERLLASDRDDFLAVATPGAGKTTFALTAAAKHLSFARTDPRRVTGVVVVAPTQHLKVQWAEAAHRFGLHLDPDWSARDGRLPADMHGIITTYQQVATRRRRCATSRRAASWCSTRSTMRATIEPGDPRCSPPSVGRGGGFRCRVPRSGPTHRPSRSSTTTSTRLGPTSSTATAMRSTMVGSCARSTFPPWAATWNGWRPTAPIRPPRSTTHSTPPVPTSAFARRCRSRGSGCRPCLPTPIRNCSGCAASTPTPVVW